MIGFLCGLTIGVLVQDGRVRSAQQSDHFVAANEHSRILCVFSGVGEDRTPKDVLDFAHTLIITVAKTALKKASRSVA